MKNNPQEHDALSDKELEEQFRNCTLVPTLFSHEAHLRLAWIFVSKYGLEKAELLLCEDIARFDQTVDDGTKFHKTLTIVATKIVAHFMNKSSADNFATFIQEFPRLKSNFKDLIASHYSYNILENKATKVRYFEPDLEPFL